MTQPFLLEIRYESSGHYYDQQGKLKNGSIVFHHGVDIAGVAVLDTTTTQFAENIIESQPIFATCSGKAVFVGTDGAAGPDATITSGYGHVLVVYCGQVTLENKTRYLYAYYGHMGNRLTGESFIHAKAGDALVVGDILGRQGNSGDTSYDAENKRTGIHLDFEIRAGDNAPDAISDFNSERRNMVAVSPDLYIHKELTAGDANPLGQVSQIDPVLLDASISPQTIAPAQSLAFIYRIRNVNSEALNVLLGASIRQNGTSAWIDDPQRDVVITVSPGVQTFSRAFIVPTNVQLDQYDVAWTLAAKDGSQWLARREDKAILTIQLAMLAVSATSLPNAAVGVFYSTQLVAVGGSRPYNWSVSTGGLPSGLRLDPSSGVISGTPFSAGVFVFTIRVTDSGSPQQSAMGNLSITVSTAAPVTVGTNWQGQWVPDSKTCAPPPYAPQAITVELLQNANQMTGTLSGPGIFSGIIRGTLVQGIVEATLDFGVQPPNGTLRGTIAGNRFSGYIEEYPRFGYCTWTGSFDLTLAGESLIPGGYITFRSNRNSGQFDIFLYNLSNAGLVPLPGLNDPVAYDELASLSADGRLIAFDSSRSGLVDVFLYDRQASSLVNLPNLNDPAADDRNPVLSPDGRFILFRSNRNGTQFDIYLYDRLSSAFVNLPGLNDPSAYEKDYQMTADGRFLVFASDRNGTQVDVFLYDTVAKSLVSLPGLNDANANDDQPTIDDSGRFIAFHSSRRPLESIILLYDRQTQTLIDPPGVNVYPASNNFPWLSADGNFVIFDKMVGNSRDVVLYDLKNRFFVPLPLLNDSVAEDSFPRITFR